MKSSSMRCFALLSLLIASGSATAQDHTLALWITEPLGVDSVEKCQSTGQTLPNSLPNTAPIISEKDVIKWDAKMAHWTLKKAKFSQAEAIEKVQDHCFVLALNGKIVSRGVVLSSYSARLTKMPTITTFYHEDALSLQLNAGNVAGIRKTILTKEIDAVLGSSKR